MLVGAVGETAEEAVVPDANYLVGQCCVGFLVGALSWTLAEGEADPLLCLAYPLYPAHLLVPAGSGGSKNSVWGHLLILALKMNFHHQAQCHFQSMFHRSYRWVHEKS